MSRDGLNDSQVDALADRLRGTQETLIAALEDMELPETDCDEIEHQLLAVNVELCKGCQTWCDTNELEDDGDNGSVCSECR